MGILKERNVHFSHLALRSILITAGSLPRLPPLTPKTVYPTVGLSFYLPLFEILPYLNKVRTAWALEWQGWRVGPGRNKGAGCVSQRRYSIKELF